VQVEIISLIVSDDVASHSVELMSKFLLQLC